MAFPQPAIALPLEICQDSLILTTKPGASIHYSFACSNSVKHKYCLVVFLNGLMSNQASWLNVMAGSIRQSKMSLDLSSVQGDAGFPSLLAYDRYGSGLTDDQDPQDQGREKGHGHDVADAVGDLHEIISQVANKHLDTLQSELCLVLVGNSIGCAIARLYAQIYPGAVAGLLLLDSIMANSDFDVWPDPSAENFEAEQMPDDVDVDLLLEQRAKYVALFHPDVVNKEGLSRKNLVELLPDSNLPMLVGPDGRGPFVTVAGHDFGTFAQDSLMTLGTPTSLSMKYLNPLWHAYNEGLTDITDKARSKGPVIAKGCGHFIQKDDPGFVVAEVNQLLDKVLKSTDYENLSDINIFEER